jgi:hypothetical protein
MPEVHEEAWGSHIAAVGLSHLPRVCAHSSKAGQVYGKLLQRRTVSLLLAADATMFFSMRRATGGLVTNGDHTTLRGEGEQRVRHTKL